MKIPFSYQRRTFIKRLIQYSVLGLFALSTPLAGSLIQNTQAQTKPKFTAKEINLAYQTSGDIVKVKKVVEPRFKALGVKVNWVGPFPAGPQLIEAMNAGKVDIGTVGETPPIFSQAAGITEVIYIAGRTPSQGENQGIVVRADSPIKKLADIKGKKVAFQRGSNAHYLLAKALQEVGLKITDVQIVGLTPSEARDAFIQNKVEVWVASDPFLALVENIIPIRNLRNAARINTLGGFYLGRRAFITQNPELARVFLEEADKVGEWAEKNPTEVAKAFAPELKLEVPVLEKVARRRTFRLRKLTPAIIEEQQRVADFYFQEKIIPRNINIKDALLPSQSYETITPKRLN
ncbi:aliphatic sulfonate ABC transporter substrate-binding protein [Aetokthonos hydrillicola Thurmond2011]|jgi:sulfonate transport system substrate-binding protein|uniref:Putative aliphatic sulfonates-binding protein n=1 Tax=Aetokthonos hydrillicola Thurmond2011 TaxID=2712845 RepID=A0AAP5I1D2_9CYAN|nr:aliphatic sulfonate ABC transporter substrate-binding protein [Aetokthonos hydrillicola]MBO3460182.1 aliphatic sulfonate ABC transporter substrate-binding protein [Aetokthonos hydrillicola CCALA 1050]MBW4590552.1 aliphatic sulfonate ABC transporter substrate-binding protein [Aetokthonos hydrillicola CCALA 1050]MDR9893039.1 aliphatic sulfonate ABC transporter substrate-binding protein [Aetokthonos hydrillicola Thurmond2011]